MKRGHAHIAQILLELGAPVTDERRLARLHALELMATRVMPRLPRRQRDHIFATMSSIARTEGAPEVRESALYTLRSLFEGRVASVMLDLLADLTAPASTRAEAADGLGYLGPSVVARGRGGLARAETTLRHALEDEYPDVRFWSLYAVGALGLVSLADEVGSLAGDRATTSLGHEVGREATLVASALAGLPFADPW